MEAKKLKEACGVLFDYFDIPYGEVAKNEPSFENLLGELFREEWDRIEPVVDKAGIWEEAVQFYYQRSKVAFALGYVVGRLVDPGEKKIFEAEKAIEKVVKEKRLLLCFPRTRKREEEDMGEGEIVACRASRRLISRGKEMI